MLSFLAMAHFLIPSGPILLEARIGPENGVVGSVGRPPRDTPPILGGPLHSINWASSASSLCATRVRTFLWHCLRGRCRIEFGSLKQLDP